MASAQRRSGLIGLVARGEAVELIVEEGDDVGVGLASQEGIAKTLVGQQAIERGDRQLIGDENLRSVLNQGIEHRRRATGKRGPSSMESLFDVAGDGVGES